MSYHKLKPESDDLERECQEAAELRYRIVADFTYDWEYWQAPDGTLRYVSPSCARITGYEAGQFLARPQLLDELILSEDREAWAEHRHTAKQQEPGEVQFRIRRQDGEVCWIEHVCQPITDEQGVFWGYRASNRDITARKRAEEELRSHRGHLEELIDERTAELAKANSVLRAEVAERERAEEGQRRALAEALQATQALRKSTERVRGMFQMMTDGITFTDLQGTIVDLNEAVVSLHGFESKDEIIGRSAFDLIAEGDRANAAEGLQRTLTTGRSGLLEYRLLAKNGREFDGELSAVLLRDEQGQPSGFVALTRDITARKHVEQAIWASQQFLQSALNSLSANIAILDEAGTIVAVNASWCRFAEENGLGWTDYGVGRNYLAVLEAALDDPTGNTHEVAGGIRAVIAGRYEQFSMEYPCHSPDEPRWFIMHVTRFEGGNGVRVVTAHENITERKLAEQARARMASIVESSDDAIIGKALDGTIHSWNVGAARLYGYSAQEVMGQSISILLPPDRPDEVSQVLERLACGEGVAHFETRRVRKDGQQIDVSLNISPIKDETGKVIGASTISRDITARKLAEQALQEAKEAAEAASREEQARRQEAEQRRRIAEGLGDILTVLNSNRSLSEVLDYIVVQAGQLLGTRAAGIYSLESETGALAVQAAQGLLVTYIAGADIPIGQEALRQAMATRQPVAVTDLVAVLDRGGDLAQDDVLGVNVERRVASSSWAYVYRALLAVPIIVQGQVYGGMLLYYGEPRTFSEEEVELAIAFGDQVALAIGNAQLREQSEQAATIAERDRLARELHDAVTQTLFSAGLIAEALPRVWEYNPERGRRGLEEIRQLTRGAAAEMRTMLLELRPAALTEKPLGELLRHLTEAMTSRTRVPIALTVEGDSALPPDIQIALYRIAQEALNNVAKHARASLVSVDLQCQLGWTALCISDDGSGFDPNDILPDRFGVNIMHERAREIGADMEIGSQPGQGTEIKVTWPGVRGG